MMIDGRNRLMWMSLVLGILVAAFLPLTANSGEEEETVSFERMLPKTTHFFLSFKNPAGQKKFKNSALGKIRHEPEMEAFCKNAREQVAALAAEQAQNNNFPTALLREVFRRQITVAFTGLSVGAEGRMEPGVVVSAVIQMEPANFEKMALASLQKLGDGKSLKSGPAFKHNGVSVKKIEDPPEVLYYTFLENRILVSASASALTQILDLAEEGGESLADTVKFQKVMKKAGGTGSMVSLYTNTHSLLQQFGGAAPPAGREVLQESGATDIEAIGFCSQFADRGLRDRFYIYAPGKRPGFLPRPQKPVDMQILRCIPVDASSLSVFRLDATKMYEQMLKSSWAANPQLKEESQREIQKTEEKLGFRIKEDLLASLGTQFGLYQAPGEMVAVVEVSDREKFESVMRTLTRNLQEKTTMKRMKYRGVTIRYLPIIGVPVPLLPSHTYYKNYAVFGFYPQTIKSFVLRLRNSEKSILDNQDFRRVTDNLKNKNSIGYQDARGQLLGFYRMLVLAAPMLNGIKKANFRPELLPPPRTIKKYLFGLSSTTTTDDEGILAEVYSPAGSGGIVLALFGQFFQQGDGSQSVKAASLAMGAAMVLPAIGRARQAARKAACVNNLHNVGMSMVMYQNDHGRLPEGLADLYPDYLDEKSVLVCPTDNTPTELTDKLKSSYRYVGPIQSKRPGATIIAYDKKGNHEGGRNCLFLDSHVSWVQEANLQNPASRHSLASSYKHVLQAAGEDLSEARKKELKKFYGIEEGR